MKRAKLKPGQIQVTRGVPHHPCPPPMPDFPEGCVSLGTDPAPKPKTHITKDEVNVIATAAIMFDNIYQNALQQCANDIPDPWSDDERRSIEVLEATAHGLKALLSKLTGAAMPEDDAPPDLPTLSALGRIAAERRRQVEKGYTAEHDDRYNDTVTERGGEPVLTSAAITYLLVPEAHGEAELRDYWWPWNMDTFKPGDRMRDLEKAGGLIVAAMEQLERKTARAEDKKDN